MLIEQLLSDQRGDYKRMKKIKNFGEDDQILRFAVIAVIALFALGMIVVAVRAMNPRVDASSGVKKLEELDAIDVKSIDTRIQELEEEERASDEAWANRPNSEKFANCLILGDSITQGLYEYGVLDSAFVIAEKGAATDPPGNETLTNMLNITIGANPRKVFLALGMNDAAASPEKFIQGYRQMVETLQAGLPETEIYINSILPAHASLIEQAPHFGNVPTHNQNLAQLCEEMGIIFIDNTSLVQEAYYAEDGIHMSPSYYPEWLNHMAEEAKL